MQYANPVIFIGSVCCVTLGTLHQLLALIYTDKNEGEFEQNMSAADVHLSFMISFVLCFFVQINQEMLS